VCGVCLCVFVCVYVHMHMHTCYRVIKIIRMEVRVNGSFSLYKCCDLQRLISAEVLE
jgi:hypothetical protein